MVDAQRSPFAQLAKPGWTAELRAFGALALPMVVSRLGVAGFGLADGLMLAHHSADQLAVNALADSLMLRLLDVAMMVVTAGLALVAQARTGGGGAARRIGMIWQNAMLVALVMGVMGVALGWTGGGVLKLMGQPEALLSDAGQVLMVLGLGVAPALLAMVCAGVLEALNRPVTVAIAVVLANLLNVLLNQWFIYGGAGVPGMGALGSAWSTWVVRVGLALVLMAALWWLPERDALGVRAPFGAPSWREGAEFRRRGLAGAGNVGVLAVLSLGLPMMAGWLGVPAVAQITVLFLSLLPAMVLVWGLGDAAGLRVAAWRGEMDADPAAAGPIWQRSLRLGLVLAVLLAALVGLYAVFQTGVLSLVARDPLLVAAVQALLSWGLAALVGDGVSVCLAAMLRSLGVLRGAFVVHLVSAALVAPLGWLLAFPMALGLEGLVAAHATAALLRAILLFCLYRRAARELDLHPSATSAVAA